MGHTVYIPFWAAGTATAVTPGTEASAQDHASASPKSITVNQWYYDAAHISKLAKKEQLADYMKGATESCAYSVAKQIDTSVNALFSGLSSSVVHGADAQTFTDAIFRALVETLDEADVPSEFRVLIGDPSTKADVLDIDKFVRVDYVRTPVVPTGMIGELYGSRIFVTNNLTAYSTGSYGVYAHRDAIGIAVQLNPNVLFKAQDEKFIAGLIVVDAAWGVAELRDTFGKSFYTRKS